MTTDAPTIPQTREWRLLCEAIRGATYETLSGRQKELLLDTTFALTDAYGDYVPDQWDWSGLRDSSPEAQTRMGLATLALLTAWGKMPLVEGHDFAPDKHLGTCRRCNRPEAGHPGETFRVSSSKE